MCESGTIFASVSSGEEGSIAFSTQGDDILVGDVYITVDLVDSDGNSTGTITSSKPGKVIATVNGSNKPMIVTFTTDVGIIPIATAITNDSNEASVDILAGGSLGAGTVTASIESGESGEALLVVGSSTVVMGSGSPFIEGKAEISLAQISAGGTTVVSVSIIDDQGALFTEPVDVNFSSSCSSLNTPTAELSSPITTSNGTATSTYLAKGCVGNDPINATANAGGINLSATTSVNVLPANIGSIEFISASPENISILGTGSLGGSESSTVKFRVLDTNSNPVNNQLVNFSLNTDVGGIKLIPDSATTNNLGIVQTVINSGTVATSVRVQATIDGSDPAISSQSSVLVVSTGIPDQDSFSLSADILNPEGRSRDGTTVEVTARLADAYNNPVPDGTAVSFTTEGGSIEPSCVTANGACSVTWTSQYPRPEGHVLGDVNNPNHVPEEQNTMGQRYGGRATIIATAIGEESFPDLNGNGRFDASEVTAFKGNDVSGRPYDLKEAFADYNEDGFYNPGETNASEQIGGELEEFLDFNNDGVFTTNDGKYNGVLCSIPAHAGCSDNKSLNVRAQLTLVMSGSTANLELIATEDAVELMVDDPNFVDDPDDPNDQAASVPNSKFNPSDEILYITGENTGFVTLTIADLHNQPMPAGSKITFTPSVGGGATPSSFDWPNDNHNGGLTFVVGIKGAKEATSGVFYVSVETLDGAIITPFSPVRIIIE
ncbi:Ig-like domain-containing protein [Colwellia sp. MSW7]|uniref:Ig-like domain-containing protein n=1 Tax=Colwellia maritima TaxID=2912588 RepID=A0ABS9WZF2_9GAMM|nr:Ig-like domain-containing protein [Colwellia maritima]MCI2283368.1 Ig-like domain-containing protein [Colwellia maritima]